MKISGSYRAVKELLTLLDPEFVKNHFTFNSDKCGCPHDHYPNIYHSVSNHYQVNAEYNLDYDGAKILNLEKK